MRAGTDSGDLPSFFDSKPDRRIQGGASADIPELERIFLDYPDSVLKEFGAHGLGEIRLTGVASVLTSAVYHATGVRVRNLPVRIEQLLGAANLEHV